MILSVVNVGFILIYYGIETARYYNQFVPVVIPDAVYIAMNWQRGIYWFMSLIALIMLKAKLRKGELMHVSHLCINHHKVHGLMSLKFSMMTFFILTKIYPDSQGLYFVLSIHRIVWFASCIRIASTRFLPGTQLPIVQAIRHGRHHRGGMGMGRGMGMGMGGGGMMQPNTVYVESQPVY